MKPLYLSFLVLTLSLSLAATIGSTQAAPVAAEKPIVSVQAAGRGKPYLNLQDGRAVQLEYTGDQKLTEALRSGQANARALASADLDGNGTPDLVAGYALNGGGVVTVQRGNPDAFAPQDESVFVRMQQGYNPESLLPSAEVYEVPEPVDFLEVGDFNHDNRKDVLVAARGGNLYLLAGDGRGGLKAPEEINLPGTVTSLTAGEFRAPDGWTDAAVGVAAASGAELLIFDGVNGVTSEPMHVALPATVSAVEFGEVDASPFMGIVVATGNQIEIIHGWGRKQFPSLESQIETIDAASDVRGLALGFFLWNREGNKQIAALSEDGTIRILQRGEANAQALSEYEIQVRARKRLEQRKSGVDVETVRGWKAAKAEQWSNARQIVTGNAPGADATAQNLLRRTHVSFVGTDDLLVMGAQAQRLDVVRQVDVTAGPKTNLRTTAGDMVMISLDTAAAPATALALPQKLNGERSLFLLQAGSPSPIEISLHTAATVTVDRTDDPSGAGLTAASVCGAGANDCSLRGAVQFANANPGTSITLPAGTYTLNINGAGGCTIENSTTGNTVGDLEINQTTTITGGGAASTIIDQIGTGDAGHPGDRAICMDVPLAPNLTFSFSGLTIAGGRDSGINGGGGILGGAKGTTLNLTNVIFANNQASGASFGGGGATVTGGNMTVTNCTFGAANLPGASRTDLTLGNSASTSGGGLAYTSGDPAGTNGAVGTLTVTGTTFTHNTSSSGSSGGGGLDVFGLNLSTPTVNVSTSAFTSNQAKITASGGGMINEAANVTLASTTFTSNSANNRGGAIYCGGGSTLLDGTNPSLTFTSNTATSGGSSISTAAPLNVAGTNTTIGGSIEISAGGVWTNNTGSALNPTDIVIVGGTLTCNNTTMNVSGNFTLGPSGNGLFGGTFNGNTGTVNLAGNLTTNTGGTMPAPSFNGNSGTFNFNGSGAQSSGGTLSPTFNNLTVNKSAGTLTLGVNSSVTGNLTVTAGTFDLGAFTVNRSAAGGTLTVSNGSSLKIGSTNSLPSNYNTHSIGATSTIEYEGANQTVSTLNSSQTYGNLIISGSGTKGLQAATTVATDLTINGGTLDATASNFFLNVGGSWSNNVGAANFNPRTATVTFNGNNNTQTLGGTSSTTFNSLTSNHPGTGGLSLGNSITVNGVLTLTNGNITTNANILSIGSAGTRSHTSGYILGNEKKTYGGAGSFTFDVGTANGYSPVDSTITAGTGDLTVLAVQGAQPSVVSNRSLQRYWTLTEGGPGITANLVFHYLDPIDIMGTESNYQSLQVTSGVRTYFANNCPTTCVDAAANTFIVSGITNFSDFTAGEARADLQITSVTDAPDPVIVGNNITYTINLINNGPDSSTNVTVTDAVPPNTTFVSVSTPAGWTRSDVVPVGGTGNIVFTKGSVASAETAALQIVVKVNLNAVGGSTITNSATAASAITTDPTPGNNGGTATTLVHTPPVITSANNVSFVAGSAGSFTVTTTGFPAPTIARGGVALPTGVTFVSNGDGTGTLSGTPAAGTGGTYTITFTATNAAGTTPAQSFTLTVNQAPAITSANNTTFVVGTNGNFQLAASGFPTSYTFTNTGNALPNGVTLSASGLLSGTPAAGTGGVYNLTFTVSNGIAPNATQSFTLTVNQAPAITSVNSTTFTVGTVGNFNVIATGFPAPAINLTSGTLPAGVNYGTGTLAGTPTVFGTFPLTFTASNGVGSNAVQSFSLIVNPSASGVKSGGKISQIAGGIRVSFVGNPGTQYTVQYVGFLPATQAQWNMGILGTPTAQSDGTFFVDDNSANATTIRFYRAIIP